tara:strand:+ start:12167 stop:12529 length:363 start_codon:yes stop_codon:yes gene_type:complete
MASLIKTLSLTSTDTASDALSLSVTDTVTVTAPSVDVARTSIATGSAQALIASNSAFSYVYIKVVSGANATDFLQVKIDGNVVFKIRVGEFAFFPLYNSLAITAESYGGATTVEYGFWSI